jgi:hypothetical protein
MNHYLKHFIAGAIISLLTLAVFAFFVHVPVYGWDAGVAAILVVIIGLGKEVIWDKWLGKGTPDYYDFFSTVCGGWGMIFLWKIIELFFI